MCGSQGSTGRYIISAVCPESKKRIHQPSRKAQKAKEEEARKREAKDILTDRGHRIFRFDLICDNAWNPSSYKCVHYDCMNAKWSGVVQYIPSDTYWESGMANDAYRLPWFACWMDAAGFRACAHGVLSFWFKVTQTVFVSKDSCNIYRTTGT